MTADIVKFPAATTVPYDLAGPAGPLYAEILEGFDILDELLPEVPFGITANPKAEASAVTLTELAQVRDLLNQVSDIIERVNEREARTA